MVGLLGYGGRVWVTILDTAFFGGFIGVVFIFVGMARLGSSPGVFHIAVSNCCDMAAVRAAYFM